MGAALRCEDQLGCSASAVTEHFVQVNPWDPFIFSFKKTMRKQASFPGAADTVHTYSTRA